MQYKQTKISYYAVARGVYPGIYMNWSDCKAQVDNFKNPVFRKFDCKQDAELFVQNKGKYSSIVKETDINSVTQRYEEQALLTCPQGKRERNLFLVARSLSPKEQHQTEGERNVFLVAQLKSLDNKHITKSISGCNNTAILTVKDPNDNYIEDFLEKVGLSPEDCLFVFTDGGCKKNGYSGAIAGIGIYFADNDPRNKSILVNGKSTNNIAELQAFIELYPIIQQYLVQEQETGIISTITSSNDGTRLRIEDTQVWPSNVLKDPIETKDSYSTIKQIVIVSDSVYAIRCVTEYGEKCEQDQWTNPIPNLDLVKRAYSLYKNCSNVYFAHIMAHTKGNGKYSKGNENADKLANQAMNFAHQF